MTVSFLLILACLAGGLLAYRLSVFAVALIAPVLGLLAYFISGGIWVGIAAFGAVQLGYAAPVAWVALFRKDPPDEETDAVMAETPAKSERAKSAAEGLLP
jgi:hypothetical protein